MAPPIRVNLPAPDGRGSGLVDVLDRVLDKGLVVAGDVKISLAEVELLTIRIRLIVCSIDKAQQIGLSAENEELRKQVRVLERKIASLTSIRSTGVRRQRRDGNAQGD
jgi:hypothetical protein